MNYTRINLKSIGLEGLGIRDNDKQNLNQIRVVLVDDHHIVRQGLRNFLESYGDIRVVGEASNGEELLVHIERWLPDVVVMDLLMPGGIHGIEAIRQVRKRSPHTQIVILTASIDDARLVGLEGRNHLIYSRGCKSRSLARCSARLCARSIHT